MYFKAARLMAFLAASLVVAASPSRAQGASGEISFNLFQIEGLTISDIFVFDDAFGEEYGIDVPVPFSVRVPWDSRILRIVDGKPSGGAFVKFTFGLEDVSTDERVLLENLQVTTVTIPLYADHDDPALARQRSAVVLARDHVFPRFARDHESLEILTIEALTIGEVAAVQLIGQFVTPDLGPMLLRAVILPHPEQEPSLIAVAMINLTLVPVHDRETLSKSLTGRILTSWEYR